MPRKARLDAPGALHHIMVRGINKSAIFDDDQDRIKFLERLGENVIEAKCEVYALGAHEQPRATFFLRAGERAGINVPGTFWGTDINRRRAKRIRSIFDLLVRLIAWFDKIMTANRPTGTFRKS